MKEWRFLFGLIFFLSYTVGICLRNMQYASEAFQEWYEIFILGNSSLLHSTSKFCHQIFTQKSSFWVKIYTKIVSENPPIFWSSISNDRIVSLTLSANFRIDAGFSAWKVRKDIKRYKCENTWYFLLENRSTKGFHALS